MFGYFARKPRDIEEVKKAIDDAPEMGNQPVRINKVAEILLSPEEYTDFCDKLYLSRQFLKACAERSSFHDGIADCVMVGSPGLHWVAVCLEGFDYPRYVAWPMDEQ